MTLELNSLLWLSPAKDLILLIMCTPVSEEDGLINKALAGRVHIFSSSSLLSMVAEASSRQADINLQDKVDKVTVTGACIQSI